MEIKRTLFVVSLLTALSACATTSRPDLGDAPTNRSVEPAQIAENAEPSPAAAEPVADQPQPAQTVESAAQVAQPAAAAAVDKPAAVMDEPPQAVVVAEPVQAPKVVKAIKPVQSKPPAATPREMPKPVPDAAPSAPSVAEASDAPDASRNRIEGSLELIAGSGQTLSADEMSQAVVYFVPDSSAGNSKPGHYRIYTHNKEFEPASMVIPLGSTISFPNQDEILHNVFSVSPQSSFDLGIYGEGKSADYTFKKTGLVLINCNVHQSMQANVLVVNTSYIASPDTQGRFALDNLPAGGGKLAIWHPRGNVQEQSVSVPLAKSVALRMVLTKPRITEHLNKENKAYR
ncbi:MAG TPA: hypothetical protein VFN25_00385 [Dokdonella sp.]|uniref:cupredoxin domain-containing protein n=1 Tax=Dokdonella sp. TaxID=2291710 RepID=UPI002D7FD5E6|nr:hypothetical protein [Dokdonella sp.]HET9031339.1 hypothetical protein [Dokdonella sp.]